MHIQKSIMFTYKGKMKENYQNNIHGKNQPLKIQLWFTPFSRVLKVDDYGHLSDTEGKYVANYKLCQLVWINT
jgi:hypothetical protein